MLNRTQFVMHYKAFLQLTGLVPEQVIVQAGGAMLMLGLREETSDLDLGLYLHDFNIVVDTLGLETRQLSPRPINAEGDRDIATVNEFVDIHPVPHTRHGMLTVDGVWISNPQATLKLKLELNRSKDQRDIIALRNYIAATAGKGIVIPAGNPNYNGDESPDSLG